MNNLSKFGVQKLNLTEIKKIQGGWRWFGSETDSHTGGCATTTYKSHYFFRNSNISQISQS
ncbi:hypothetical protein [Tenacibaculum finnmarkense]|uniref:Bacteriocin n=1 Tax=Tenacibaculum finnmarkense genomovar ulcerans TaxID=2781388 RepID=A0A2I2M809_9FLAO|nr:hypothetical protein [Tenacibaculum finnmarkense]MBE7632906.1 hypothetical protein [Tenacibaculum finnmarkense genomovar ulcerans]MBE7644560.1 hypothetical protein [Tenacibaculum finnmarkense genomovar ulcerans]MBE7697146.1 hypothetical protein [Tenacibaculum finnmarkense genomovar ulcerans]MCD8428775.1 hypothetical protein [Tenacibaculum finnmarkense genomovar ulcerans]MCG8811969.1 hypothetical protein [Tenacibaculum finnmarkense]